MLIGAGWAWAILCFITQSDPSGIHIMQQNFKGAKKPGYKVLGIFLIMIAIILFVYSGSRF